MLEAHEAKISPTRPEKVHRSPGTNKRDAHGRQASTRPEASPSLRYFMKFTSQFAEHSQRKRERRSSSDLCGLRAGVGNAQWPSAEESLGDDPGHCPLGGEDFHKWSAFGGWAALWRISAVPVAATLQLRFRSSHRFSSLVSIAVSSHRARRMLRR